jgi:salicylate hydroxylase
MTTQPAIKLAIAGGGIGGLAAAFACRRAGCDVQVLEQARAFSEVGAGIQLGPNVTRVLHGWGLGARLDDLSAAPESLIVRDAAQGRELGRMQLGSAFNVRYGSPYLTIHRADLQHLLLEAARAAGAELRLEARVAGVEAGEAKVTLRLQGYDHLEADALIAADGVWSAIRDAVFGDGAAKPSGHIAYRALAPQDSLPASVRTGDVNLWLGSRTHVVAYPVRRGELLNVVAIVEARQRPPSQDWDQGGLAADLLRAMGSVNGKLRELIEAMPAWRVWTLHGRPPVASPQAMARGRVALLGDAAHPMLPYLAQGAGMAIEDAHVLARVLQNATASNVAAALASYANERWQRCAQVQSGALRNATIFHADGALRFGRDTAMRFLGERLLDQPWLYGFSV